MFVFNLIANCKNLECVVLLEKLILKYCDFDRTKYSPRVSYIIEMDGWERLAKQFKRFG